MRPVQVTSPDQKRRVKAIQSATERHRGPQKRGIIMKQYVAHCQSGYYGYDREVTVSRRLGRMPYAQAGIIDRPNGTMLVSYETIVAEIIDGWMHVYGLFSATTRKHIGAYLHEVAPRLCYQDARRCYEDDLEMNVETGEVRPAAQGMIQTIGIRVS